MGWSYIKLGELLRLFLIASLLGNGALGCAMGACHALHPGATIARRQKVAIAASGVFVARRHYMTMTQKPLFALAGVCLMKIIKQQKQFVKPRIFLLAEGNEKENGDGEEATPETKEERSVADEAMSSAMVASLGFYKQVISPLLPPACRFVPTCSQYGVQAIKEFGPSKGAVLIAWRLMRCSPFGGKGYDPPAWPPVHFTYSSY